MLYFYIIQVLVILPQSTSKDYLRKIRLSLPSVQIYKILIDSHVIFIGWTSRKSSEFPQPITNQIDNRKSNIADDRNRSGHQYRESYTGCCVEPQKHGNSNQERNDIRFDLLFLFFKIHTVFMHFSNKYHKRVSSVLIWVFSSTSQRK